VASGLEYAISNNCRRKTVFRFLCATRALIRRSLSVGAPLRCNATAPANVVVRKGELQSCRLSSTQVKAPDQHLTKLLRRSGYEAPSRGGELPIGIGCWQSGRGSECARTTQRTTPTVEESIRRRAYEIWEQSGRPDGADLDHWLQAKSEHNGQRAHTRLKSNSEQRGKSPTR
jgi:hypothetical protein